MLVVSVCLVACSSDDESANDVIVAGDCYLRLDLSYGKPTRATTDHPHGGESGDGTEDGRNHENEINNICIFIYHDSEGNGVNDDPSTPIKAKYYFDDLDLTLVSSMTYRTKPLKLKLYQQVANDRIIVIANRGDVTSDFSTLADFHAKESNCWDIGDQWTDNVDATKCKDFVMTSSNAIDGGIDIATHEGTYLDPFTASVDVERVMARIDFWYYNANAGTEADPRLTFTAEDGTGILKLSHLRIVNMPQTKSTMPLKMVSTGYDETSRTNATLLGNETVVTGTFIPNNYVHTWLTCQKNDANALDDTWLNTYYKDNLAASKAKDASGPTFLRSDNYKVYGYTGNSHVFSTTEYDFGTVNNYIVGYAPENTMPKSQQKYQYMTGLAVKGTYEPTNVYKWESGAPVIDASYVKGHDLWHYVDIEDPDPLKSYFFSSEAAVNAYSDSRPSIAHSIVKYTNAECYYYIWIRHAIFDTTHPTGTYPMEYAIVRNNIYRIGVSKVISIGTPEPDPDDEKAYSKIFVRKWRFRKAEEIVL